MREMLSIVAITTGLLAAGCDTELELDPELDSISLVDPIPIADVLAGVTGVSDATQSVLELQTLTVNQRRGRRLFNEAKFGGNGRTCATCHPSAQGQSGGLSPADVQARFAANPNDPLFKHDGADLGSPTTFNRLLNQATFQIVMPLPANVSIVGSSARSVTLLRSVPTTMNVPALDPVLMWDGRQPTLQAQAAGAIVGHAQGSSFNTAQLDAIADFETTLFNRPALRSYASGGPAPQLPQGTTPLQILGRLLFTPDGPQAKCGWCHSGPMLNETSLFFQLFPGDPTLPAQGSRFENLLLDQFNVPGNPVYTFRFTNPDGSTTDVVSADPGRALITGNSYDAVGEDGLKSKIQTVWGVKDTAPYFHDNSARNLTELVNTYDRIFREVSPPPGAEGAIFLTDLEKQALLAYLPLL